MLESKIRVQLPTAERRTSRPPVAKPRLERDFSDCVPSRESAIELGIRGGARHRSISTRRAVIAFFVVFVLTATALVAVLDPATRRAPSDRGASLENAGLVKNQNAVIRSSIGEPDFLDPAVDYETAGGEILLSVYETLVWYNRSSASDLVPILATEVPTLTNGGISSDGLNYTFNLKSGVKFHDNTTMDADDVIYSFVRVLRIHDPYGPSWMLEQYMNDYIKDYVGGELQYFSSAPHIMAAIGGTDPGYIITERDVQNASEAAVVKVDSDTVTLRLTHPYPAFLSMMAYTVASIVSEDFVEANGGVTNGEHNAYMDENTCGTGPYKLVSWELGSKIHLTRWDGYHGAAPKLKDVYVIKVNDVNTKILMLQAGDTDITDISQAYESLFVNNTNYSIVKGLPTFNIDFAGFNLNINATAAATFGSDVPSDFFANKIVRKAFEHLMDIDLFINGALGGNAIPLNGPIPTGMLGHNSSAPTYDYNLTKAMEYLQNATNPLTGHSWWTDGFTVAFIYNVGNSLRQTACNLMKQALDSLSSMPGTHGTFQATINALDWPTYMALFAMRPCPLPVFFLGWAPDYADPDDYVIPLLHSSGLYPWRTTYSNTTIDALIESASVEVDPLVREQMYHEITNLCFDDAPYIWLDQTSHFHIQRSWLNGYQFNPMYSTEVYYPTLWKSNDPPDAMFDIQPPAGPVLTDFTFDASGSSDPNEDSVFLEVRWDWENDSVWDTGWSTEKTATHLYASEGTYSVAMEIRDSVGLINITYGTVVVDNAIPEFSSALIPILFIAAMVTAIRMMRKRRP
jgi:peptide/nickel transport system substrate-binding protein